MGIFGTDTPDFTGIDFSVPATPGSPGDFEQGSSSSGGDFGPIGKNGYNAKPNSAFVTGLNLLLSNPTAFWNTLTSDNADSVPTPDVNRAATGSIAANAKAGPIPNPTQIPLWVEIALIGTIGVVGLIAIGFLVHEVK